MKDRHDYSMSCPGEISQNISLLNFHIKNWAKVEFILMFVKYSFETDAEVLNSGAISQIPSYASCETFL